MSDRLDSLFDDLRGQRPPAPFASAAAVRHRGRQRAQRHAVAAGVAVLAVTGLGAGGLAVAAGVAVLAVTGLGAGGLAVATGQPAPDPPPAASAPVTGAPTSPATPDQAGIPAAWLLTAEDLPGGAASGWTRTTNELLEGEWYWDGAQPWCPEYTITDYPSVRQRRDLRTASWHRPEAALPERVDQLVERFAPGGATANLADVRAFVTLCSREPEPGDTAAPTVYRIEDADFAGDEALLIRVEQYQFNDGEIEPMEELHQVAVVRVGDVVTTIRLLNLTGDPREVADQAAARLG